MEKYAMRRVERSVGGTSNTREEEEVGRLMKEVVLYKKYRLDVEVQPMPDRSTEIPGYGSSVGNVGSDNLFQV
jgi:hypothetical protein